MRNHLLLRTIFILILIWGALSACRREEEPEPLPTAVPTAALPQPTNTKPATGPTATAVPRPTATPAPVINPAAIDWPPQLVYSSPAPGEEALLDGAITIRFDQDMDQAAVESAFEITAVTNDQAISGTFTWPRADTVIFTPRNPLTHEQEYQVRVRETAVSAKGQPISEAIELRLQTVGFLEVSQVIPAADTANIQPDGAITVLFNRPVVPLVSTGQQADLPQPLTFNPPLTGQGEWVSTSIYRFTPDEPMAGATRYTATIAAGLTDITGGVLESDFSWQFSTLSPAVVSIEPANESTNVNPTLPLTITFNMPMNRASTEAAILLPALSGEQAVVSFTWSEDGRILILTPQAPLLLDTTYQVVIGNTATAASGQSTLPSTVVSSFGTVPFPAVLYTNPENNQLADRYQNGVSIGFASPMNLDTLEEQITIAPLPTSINYYFSTYNNELFINFTLERNTTYQITIPGTAADPYGHTLGADYTWSFTTPDYDPIASFNLPQGISQLSTSFVTQVDIMYRNVSEFNVALYDVGLPLNLLLNTYDAINYNPTATPLQTWSISAAAADAATNTPGLYTLPLSHSTLPTGVYFLTLNAPDLPEFSLYWQNQRNLVVVGDTNVIVKEMFGAIHVWVTEIATGQPVAGRNLTMYDVQGVQVGTAVSDANGFATITRPPVDYLQGVLIISNQPGQVGFGVGSSLWNTTISPWEFGLDYNTAPEPPTFAYLYTDRPIYRPGDTMYFKGIVRGANYGRYTLPGISSLILNLNPAFYIESGGLNDSLAYDIQTDGSFSGEYTLPVDMPLGSYQLSINNLDYNTYRTFTVAEYRKPEFLVAVTADKPETLRGETVQVTLEASYFFGGPATDLEVNWSVYETLYSPDIPGPYYSFGDFGEYYFANPDPFGFRGDSTPGNYLTGGQGHTDEHGRFTLTLPASLLDNIAAGSRHLTVEATVMDLSNFPVTGRAGITLHAAESYVGVRPTHYIAAAGTETSVEVLTVDWNGRPLGNQNVEVIFYQREWEYRRVRDAEMYRTLWEPVDTEAGRMQVRTDAEGKATASFQPAQGGTYIAVATVTDQGGRQALSSTYLWITDPAFAIGWQSDPKVRRMDLIPDKQSYRPGDTAEILVQSPFAGPVKAWLTIERGHLIEQQLITLQSSSDVLQIPISPQYAPNVHVTVTAVKPVNPNDPDNPYADVRLGITELVVSPEQLVLTVDLIPRQETFVPGETAVYNIRITDYNGQPVAADLSLSLVDLAVLTLKADNAPLIQDAFYARQPYRSFTGGSLFISGEGIAPEIPLEVFGRGGGGGGEAALDAIARAVGDDEDVRRDFPDTAYWQAHIQTDATGHATIEIPLPDSLTTWRLSSKAVSPDTLIGQTSVDVIVSLPLMIRPVTPRFFTVGDVVQLGAILNNNTSNPIAATASLEATGLLATNGQTLAPQTVNVPAHGQILVTWNVTVDDVQNADLTFRVAGGDFRDATKPTFGVGPDNLIPVYRYSAEDVTGTSGVLPEAGRRVEAILLPPALDARRGGVNVTLSPSLAAALQESLAYQENWPYETACAHAIADHLLPNAVTARALRDLNLDEPVLAAQLNEMIPLQIANIVAHRLPNGGWGWCYDDRVDDWLTAYVLFALVQAADAGYDVPAAVLAEASDFLSSTLQEPPRLTETWQIDRQIFFLYVLHLTGADAPQLYDQHFNLHRELMSPYAKALLAEMYQGADLSPENVAALLSDLSNSAIVSATGAHWEEAEGEYWRNLGSDVRNTAVTIAALTFVDPENPFLPGAVRWLMVARTAQVWSTPHETAWSILALTRWMQATGELEANYDYNLSINGTAELSGTYTPERVLQNETTTIPLRDLVPGEVNFFDFERGTGNGRLYYTLHLDSFISADTVTAVSRGVTVQRAYYDAACNPSRETCAPITQITAGQPVRVELTIIAPHDLVYAVIRDPLPAGAEAVDPNLDTSRGASGPDFQRTDQEYRYGYWGWWVFNRVEFRDAQVVFFANYLPAGTYQYTYTLQPNIPGVYQVPPATAREEFFPEVFGRSDGLLFSIIAD